MGSDGGGGGFGRGRGSNQSELKASSGIGAADAKTPKLNNAAAALKIHFISDDVSLIELLFT